MSKLPKYSTRSLFVLLFIVAILFGWFNSVRQARRERYVWSRKAEYAEQELQRKTDELQRLRKGVTPDETRSFWQAGLEGTNLASMTISSYSNAFQRASFADCNLRDASLSGGGSSFQEARFDGANLQGATLVGGSASFQAASFVKSDLTRAKLTGGPASFQQASFEEATLVDAVLVGSFQRVNLNGAKLSGADLSGIASSDLETCYFKQPPTYNAQTKFPAGFNPAQQQWRKVTEEQ